MQVISYGQQLNTPIVLCLGYFETMHVGHMQLVRTAASIAAEEHAEVALFTFDKKSDNELFTWDERLQLYKQAGVSTVVKADFTDSFRATKGSDFVKQLCSTLNVKAIVCGFDYTFGCDRCGAFELTRLLGGKQRLFVVKSVDVDGEKVSSTRVRSLLTDNKITAVNALLGHPYFVCGTVVHGRGVGHSLGFPTANISVDNRKILPHGVFAAYTTIDNNTYAAFVNIGAKPTFGVETQTIEVHAIGYDGDLYGKHLQVNFIDYLRPTVKFASVEELVKQLTVDKQTTLNLYKAMQCNTCKENTND